MKDRLREYRLADALRANLTRRKAQARAAVPAATPGASPSPDPSDEPDADAAGERDA